MVQWSNRRKEKQQRMLFKKNELYIFEEPGTIIGESGSFRITNRNPVLFLVFPHFGAFAFPLIPRLTVFYSLVRSSIIVVALPLKFAFLVAVLSLFLL